MCSFILFNININWLEQWRKEMEEGDMWQCAFSMGVVVESLWGGRKERNGGREKKMGSWGWEWWVCWKLGGGCGWGGKAGSVGVVEGGSREGANGGQIGRKKK